MGQPEPVNLVKHDAELAGEKLVIITLRHDDASLIRHDDASLIFFLDRNKSQGLDLSNVVVVVVVVSPSSSEEENDDAGGTGMTNYSAHSSSWIDSVRVAKNTCHKIDS